jgi:hypothetical protein
MSFVRFDKYTPVVRPNFQAELDQVIANVIDHTERSPQREPTGRAVRSAHAKAYGLVRASVTVLPGLPAEYAQGIYATPGTHEAAIRYSNGLAHVLPDAYLGPACGMAFKIFGVPGTSLLDDEADAGTFDYNLINNPTFFCNTVRDYVVIEPLFAALPSAMAQPASRKQWLHDFLTGAGALPPEQWLWDELSAMLAFNSIGRRNLLASSYWSMGALRHGDYIAKVRTTPTTPVTYDTIDVTTDPNAYRTTLVSELAERDHSFDLQVQLCTDLELMPVENTALDWPEAASPFVTVARVDVPRQDISAGTNLAAADGISITPWRVTEDHRPLGEIMEVRREVYRQSSIARHRINGQERREPANLAELFG